LWQLKEYKLRRKEFIEVKMGNGNDREKVKDFLSLCSDKFNNHPDFQNADKTVRKVFQTFRQNTALPNILLKVAVLNTFYKTRIFDVIKISQHISSRIENIDERIEQGDLSLVDEIKSGHGIQYRNGNEIEFLSFATKYCHWHRPGIYPIYDQFAGKALYELQKNFLFFNGRITQKDLKDYRKYKEVLDCCINFFRFGKKWHYKKIDQTLWIYGKFLERKLPPELQNDLEKKYNKTFKQYFKKPTGGEKCYP
jgi:hypothetical protein